MLILPQISDGLEAGTIRIVGLRPDVSETRPWQRIDDGWGLYGGVTRCCLGFKGSLRDGSVLCRAVASTCELPADNSNKLWWQVLAIKVTTRKLEHHCPPSPKLRRKGRQHKSSCFHVVTIW